MCHLQLILIACICAGCTQEGKCTCILTSTQFQQCSSSYMVCLKYKVLQTAFMYKCTNISTGCTLCIHLCMYVWLYVQVCMYTKSIFCRGRARPRTAPKYLHIYKDILCEPINHCIKIIKCVPKVGVS